MLYTGLSAGVYSSFEGLYLEGYEGQKSVFVHVLFIGVYGGWYRVRKGVHLILFKLLDKDFYSFLDMGNLCCLSILQNSKTSTLCTAGQAHFNLKTSWRAVQAGWEWLEGLGMTVTADRGDLLFQSFADLVFFFVFNNKQEANEVRPSQRSRHLVFLNSAGGGHFRSYHPFSPRYQQILAVNTF
ncbi:hypothetical protein BJ165DRAFT_437552 [Panaeolus papilionaceus]|nr:hypothetical protein BJ165DRAFT_437552 [Panaeolus papilionaceus]